MSIETNSNYMNNNTLNNNTNQHILINPSHYSASSTHPIPFAPTIQSPTSSSSKLHVYFSSS